ncbi:MAG: hypoxanthine phosphoribosyltransferase [Thermaerobacter sp.]|nr:hypoxanthine phosphoribosyltransferase [Thermaerobacter sp.]
MDKVERILLRREAIAKRVQELGEEVSQHRNPSVPLLAVPILRGAVIFAADLVREIKGPVELDFMSVSSYGNSSVSHGDVRVVKDLTEDIAGRDILLVEDIVDTGHTVRFLIDTLLKRGPRSLKVCALLDKVDRREVDVPIDYVGFRIPDAFVVGYGLDYAGRFRNHPEILALRPEALSS